VERVFLRKYSSFTWCLFAMFLQVIEDCPVSKILTKKNDFGTPQVSGVVTPYGAISTNYVVNCGGEYIRL
jgi:glycine/D-amino acid oxidase-like deaminating enzyme